MDTIRHVLTTSTVFTRYHEFIINAGSTAVYVEVRYYCQMPEHNALKVN